MYIHSIFVHVSGYGFDLVIHEKEDRAIFNKNLLEQIL